jgi:hypothetical protein
VLLLLSAGLLLEKRVRGREVDGWKVKLSLSLSLSIYIYIYIYIGIRGVYGYIEMKFTSITRWHDCEVIK